MNVEDFKKDLKVVDSVRAHMVMLIGLYGLSGGGKTVTALVWAVGMVGPGEKVGVIDTEQGRATIAVDVVEKLGLAHYGRPIAKIQVVHLAAPYHPLKYIAAAQMLVDAGCRAIVADSMSHSWDGDGGYLDLKEAALTRMAGADWKKREACAQAAAAQTKPHTHNKLRNFFQQVSVPLILCFRSMEKTKFGKNEQNKTEIKKDDFSTPIHDPNFIFDMLVSGEVSQRDGAGGFCSFAGPLRKITHPDIAALLPNPEEQFGFKHGEALAAWCRGTPKTAGQTPKVATEETRKWFISQLGDLAEKAQVYAIDKGLIMPNENLLHWPLTSVPTNKTTLAELKAKIQEHA